MNISALNILEKPEALVNKFSINVEHLLLTQYRISYRLFEVFSSGFQLKFVTDVPKNIDKYQYILRTV